MRHCISSKIYVVSEVWITSQTAGPRPVLGWWQRHLSLITSVIRPTNPLGLALCLPKKLKKNVTKNSNSNRNNSSSSANILAPKYVFIFVIDNDAMIFLLSLTTYLRLQKIFFYPNLYLFCSIPVAHLKTLLKVSCKAIELVFPTAFRQKKWQPYFTATPDLSLTETVFKWTGSISGCKI